MPCVSTLPKASVSACRAAMSPIALPPLALPSSGSCGRRTGALSARSLERAPADSILVLVKSPRRGEEVGQDPIDLGVESQSDMTAVDFDRVDVGAQARLPVHDPIRAGVDRGRRDARCGAKIAQEAHLDRCRMPVAQ